jgi:hypothetical protein
LIGGERELSLAEAERHLRAVRRFPGAAPEPMPEKIAGAGAEHGGDNL